MWLTQIFQIPSCLPSGCPLAHGSPGSWHTGSLYSGDSHTLEDKEIPKMLMENAHLQIYPWIFGGEVGREGLKE